MMALTSSLLASMFLGNRACMLAGSILSAALTLLASRALGATAAFSCASVLNMAVASHATRALLPKSNNALRNFVGQFYRDDKQKLVTAKAFL